MAGRDAPLAASRHTKARGTKGGVEAPLTPTLTEVTPAAASRGTTPRVMPGTSRCDRVALWGSPNSSSSACAMPTPAASMKGVCSSASELKGKACQVSQPRWMAVVTLATSPGEGQRSPGTLGGQWKNMSMSHICAVKRRPMEAASVALASMARPKRRARGKWVYHHRVSTSLMV